MEIEFATGFEKIPHLSRRKAIWDTCYAAIRLTQLRIRGFIMDMPVLFAKYHGFYNENLAVK